MKGIEFVGIFIGSGVIISMRNLILTEWQYDILLFTGLSLFFYSSYLIGKEVGRGKYDRKSRITKEKV